jgi:hypothetical protein
MTDICDDSARGLEQAPEHIQLAVDLIQLLESNRVDNELAVAALEIVLDDFKRKRLLKNKNKDKHSNTGN